MRTVLLVLAAILGLDVVLVAFLFVAGLMARRRARGRTELIWLRGNGPILRVVPPARRRPPGTRGRTKVAATALAVAIVLSGAALFAHGSHGVVGGPAERAADELGPRRPNGFRAGGFGAGRRSIAASPGRSGTRGSSGVAGGTDEPHLAATSTTHASSPSVVTAVPVSATEIKVAWDDVGDETGYRVERSPGGTFGWRTIATTPAGVTTYRDDGLPPGTTYFYRVLATTPDGASAPSDVASSTTIAMPASPGGLIAVAISSSEIDLSWGDVADETGFRVERSSDGATGWVSITTTGQAVTSYEDAGLAAGTTYYYRVFATGAGGDSPPSAVVSAATSPDDSTPGASP